MSEEISAFPGQGRHLWDSLRLWPACVEHGSTRCSQDQFEVQSIWSLTSLNCCPRSFLECHIVLIVLMLIVDGRCKCEPSKLEYGERCGKVLPFKHQVTRYRQSNVIWSDGFQTAKMYKAFSGLAGLHGGTRGLPGEKIKDWRQEISWRTVTLNIQATLAA